MMPTGSEATLQDDMRRMAERVAVMGGVVEQGFDEAVDALLRLDRDLARSILHGDDRLRALETEIEEIAGGLLMRRPASRAVMREAIATIRIAADLAKIGDLARGIARRTLAMRHETEQPSGLSAGLRHLCEITMAQIKMAVDAYIERDLAKADEVARSDDDVDSLYTALFSALLQHMADDPASVRQCAQLMLCTKNIERIGDHATDIAGALHGYLAEAAPAAAPLRRFLP